MFQLSNNQLYSRKSILKNSLLFLTLLLITSCSFNPATYNKLISANDYQNALKACDGDAELEKNLAALIIENEALLDDNNARSLLLSLESGDDAGKQALKRVAKQEKNRLASQIAKIIINPKSYSNKKRATTTVKNDNSDLRAIAATKYSIYFDTSLLFEMLNDNSDIVRGAATFALCQNRPDKKTVAAFISILTRDPKPHVRLAAANCYQHLGSNAASILNDVINSDDNEQVQKAAIKSLAALNTDLSKNQLWDKTAGTLTKIKLFAITQLLKTNFKTASTRFEHALKSSDANIKSLAIKLHKTANYKLSDGKLVEYLSQTDQIAIEAARHLIDSETKTKKLALKRLLKIWESGSIFADQAQQLLVKSEDKTVITSVNNQLKESNQKDLSRLIMRYSYVKSLRPSFLQLMTSSHKETRIAAAKAILFMKK